MNNFRIFEHQSIPFLDINSWTDLPFIKLVDELNQRAHADFIHLGYKSLKATQFVGVLQAGGLTLEILPKIDYDNTGDANVAPGSALHNRAAESAARNLLFLLSYTHNIKIHKQDLAHLATQRANWFELLTSLFAVDLHRLIQRGIVRNYVPVEDTLPLIRGRWLVERQLARRPHVRHRFDLRYDEFSSDNLLNRIFRYVVETLLPQTYDPTNRVLLLDLQVWLSDVGFQQSFSKEELDSILFTRLNEHYRPAFNLARMFVEHTILQLSAGGRQTFAFVFDMNLLFEQFVAQFLLRHKRFIFPDAGETLKLRLQSTGKVNYLARQMPGQGDVFHLKPDILVENRYGKPILIVDTKYKQLDAGRGDAGVSEGDMYQMLAYATGFDCPRTLLIYPQSAGRGPVSQEFKTYNTENRHFVATINLRQPLEKPDGLIQRLRDIFTQARM